MVLLRHLLFRTYDLVSGKPDLGLLLFQLFKLEDKYNCLSHDSLHCCYCCNCLFLLLGWVRAPEMQSFVGEWWWVWEMCWMYHCGWVVVSVRMFVAMRLGEWILCGWLMKPVMEWQSSLYASLYTSVQVITISWFAGRTVMSLWDMRFPLWCCCRFKSAGVWHCVTG
jgi:hypothetical protein